MYCVPEGHQKLAGGQRSATTGNDSTYNRIPEGCQKRQSRSFQVFRVELNVSAFQKLDPLFLKRWLSMMLTLIANTASDNVSRGQAYGKCCVTLLPIETGLFDCFMKLFRCALFYFSHEVRQSVSGFQANEQVNMIGPPPTASGTPPGYS